MADQRRWFKVWTSVVSDDDFDPSRPEGLVSLGRFSMLGAYTALHGSKGTVSITLPSLLRITSASNLDEIRADLAFKNVLFEEGINRYGKVIVTWQKWRQYQEDSTAKERMKTLRAKRRGEEKRGEESITSPSGDEAAASPGGHNGFADWPPEWEPIKGRIQTMPFLTRYARWLQDLPYWQSEDEQFRGVPATLADLLTAAAGFCERDGYVPRSKRGIRKKLHNCMEFEARRVERAKQG